jgi:hypothetical protein
MHLHGVAIKGKLTLTLPQLVKLYVMKEYGGVRRYSPAIFDLDSSCELHAPAALSTVKEHQESIRMEAGEPPRSGLEAVEKRQILRCWKSNPHPPASCPVPSVTTRGDICIVRSAQTQEGRRPTGSFSVCEGHSPVSCAVHKQVGVKQVHPSDRLLLGQRVRQSVVLAGQSVQQNYLQASTRCHGGCTEHLCPVLAGHWSVCSAELPASKHTVSQRLHRTSVPCLGGPLPTRLIARINGSLRHVTTARRNKKQKNKLRGP